MVSHKKPRKFIGEIIFTKNRSRGNAIYFIFQLKFNGNQDFSTRFLASKYFLEQFLYNHKFFEFNYITHISTFHYQVNKHKIEERQDIILYSHVISIFDVK